MCFFLFIFQESEIARLKATVSQYQRSTLKSSGYYSHDPCPCDLSDNASKPGQNDHRVSPCDIYDNASKLGQNDHRVSPCDISDNSSKPGQSDHRVSPCDLSDNASKLGQSDLRVSRNMVFQLILLLSVFTCNVLRNN